MPKRTATWALRLKEPGKVGRGGRLLPPGAGSEAGPAADAQQPALRPDFSIPATMPRRCTRSTAAGTSATPLLWRSSFSRIGNDRSPDRRLKIGYVSPDFRDHVIGRNLVPLFREHDREQFEIFCYADVPRQDKFTERFRGYADAWRNIAGLTRRTTRATFARTASISWWT